MSPGPKAASLISLRQSLHRHRQQASAVCQHFGWESWSQTAYRLALAIASVMRMVSTLTVVTR
jgi:hypothetical protein